GPIPSPTRRNEPLEQDGRGRQAFLRSESKGEASPPMRSQRSPRAARSEWILRSHFLQAEQEKPDNMGQVQRVRVIITVEDRVNDEDDPGDHVTRAAQSYPMRRPWRLS